MDKNGFVIVLILLFIVVCGQSDAFNSRKLVTTPDPSGSSNANQDSPSSPPPPDTTLKVAPVEVPKTKDTPNTNTTDLESKGSNDSYTKRGSDNSSDKKLNTGKSQDGEGSKIFASKNCKRNLICNDQGKTMMACVQDFEHGSNNLTLIVQNEQDVDLKVNITFGTSMSNFMPTFELPAHVTKEVNITFSGDKNNKVVLNAGNGDCELQISRPSPIISPSKSKNPENNSSLKDVNSAADSPAKPEDVNSAVGSPAKPEDVNNPVDSPAKPEDVNNLADSPAKPKDVDDPTKSKDKDETSKSKDVNTPPKSKDVDESSKSKDADDASKSKEADDPSKSKDADDPSKSKDADDPSKSKDVDDPSKSEDTADPSKSKEADNTTKSKSKDADDLSKSTTKNVNTPVSKNKFFDQMTFYSKQVTPMHGAYLAFLVALVIGGSWALCSIRKRRIDGGVPYQELEMGPSESSNAVDVETAEGWDQDWDDDDWDEDKAIRSPGGNNLAKTISSNGLTSRATKKDSWDADWDD